MARDTGTATQNEILIAIGGRRDCLVWRQMVGTFRAIDDPDRFVKVGLPGQADIGAIVEVEITPAMVGKRIGVAVQIESKSGQGRQRTAQQLWQHAVELRSGLYAVARSPEDALAIVKALPGRLEGK